MTLDEKIQYYREQYSIIDMLDLDQWYNKDVNEQESWLKSALEATRKDSFDHNERIVVTLNSTADDNEAVIKNFQYYLNQVGITNFFVILLVNQSLEFADKIQQWLVDKSTDPTSITVDTFTGAIVTQSSTSVGNEYRYNSVTPIGIDFTSLSDREKFLLTQSKTFCVYPWLHLHAYPTGQAYPCCGAEMRYPVGNTKTHSLQQIWNSAEQKQLRTNMLTEQLSPACNRCYEQEQAGFFSMRKSANKHHGHHISRVHETQSDGKLERFEMTYWDIRFSNLCNLSCRSCGHIFSSSWYQDQTRLAGVEWGESNTALNFAGRTEIDMWEQLVPHLDHVEQIYFAGGEPLMMQEHYRILDELERRQKFDVRLIYNTNFTQIRLKDRSVFEYWKKFKSVAVGASLDAMGARAEYIRKGTRWDLVQRNREQMLAVCPRVDFYISPTLSIMNAWHLPDFHKDWTQRGLIQAQDLNVNILQDPAHLRLDIAPQAYKQEIKQKFEEHLNWLRPQDKLQRATVGFESAVNFMMATDNSHLLSKFWNKTHQLDSIRKENLLHTLPELSALK